MMSQLDRLMRVKPSSLSVLIRLTGLVEDLTFREAFKLVRAPVACKRNTKTTLQTVSKPMLVVWQQKFPSLLPTAPDATEVLSHRS